MKARLPKLQASPRKLQASPRKLQASPRKLQARLSYLLKKMTKLLIFVVSTLGNSCRQQKGKQRDDFQL
eukprot:gene6289-153_t